MEKISEATKKKLEEETLANIEVYIKLVDAVRRSINMIDQVDAVLKEKNVSIPAENRHLRRLSEYTILLCLIWLDITTAFRIYLNAKENYEVLYSVKQLIVTINEGFKKIYNYISVAKDGNLKTGERNKSFWVKDIGNIVNQELTILLNQYDTITQKLNEFDDQELKDMKDPRNLFVHYDDDPSKVYDELFKQDIEKISLKTIPFMAILSDMVKFCKQVLLEYNLIIQNRKDSFFDEHHKKLEDIKVKFKFDENAMQLLNSIQNDLLNFKHK